MCNQTWKTEGRGEQFVAKCDYYDLSLFFFFSTRSVIDESQSRSKTSKQENTQTILLRASQFPAHLIVPGPTRRKLHSESN